MAFLIRPLTRLSSPLARSFSTTIIPQSHIGSSPIFVPSDVKFETIDLLRPRIIPKGRSSINLSRIFSVSGPRGTVDLEIADFVDLNHDASGEKLDVRVLDKKNKIQRQLWGTTRSLINNSIIGVTEGHMTTLKLVGTGYRAMLHKDEDGINWVKLKIGKCNLQGLPIPKDVQVTIPNPAVVILEGPNKQSLNLFAGKLRRFHPPEPYKGKGIYMNDEKITLKVRKVK